MTELWALQYRKTPLKYASWAGKLDVVKYLVKCKADVDARDEVKQSTESIRLLVGLMAELWVL